MKPHLLLPGLLLICTLVSARRIPRAPRYPTLQFVDPEETVSVEHNEENESEYSQENSSEEDPQPMEKRALGGNSYPAYARGLGGVKSRVSGDKNIIEGCKTKLEKTPHSTIDCKQYTGCRVECEDGYRFPDRSVLLMFVCSDGQWQAQGTDYKTIPECIEDEDDSDYEEETCDVLVPGEHSRLDCPTNTYCQLFCHKGYKLPDNKKYVDLSCEEGKWAASELEDKGVPACVPEKPVCVGPPPVPPKTILNCPSDTECAASCEKGWRLPSGGSSMAISCGVDGWTIQADGEEDATEGCQREPLTCNGQPPVKLENATIECGETRCTATCMDNHKFPNQKSAIDIECRDDQWKVVGIDWKIIPDCLEEMKTNTKCNGSQYLEFPGLGAYKVNTSHVSWPAAQKSCMHEGSHLAVIDSPRELELMKELIAPYHMKNSWTYAHIGFTDQAKRGVWVTVLGSILQAAKFTKWAPRNPSRMNERCGAIDHQGRLHDIFCSSEQIFICERV